MHSSAFLRNSHGPPAPCGVRCLFWALLSQVNGKVTGTAAAFLFSAFLHNSIKLSLPEASATYIPCESPHRRCIRWKIHPCCCIVMGLRVLVIQLPEVLCLTQAVQSVSRNTQVLSRMRDGRIAESTEVA